MKKITQYLLGLPDIFIKSMINFKFYKILYKLPKRHGIFYIIILSALFSIIALIPSATTINKSMNEFENLYNDNAPNFKVEDGRLILPESGPVYMLNDDKKAFVVVFDDTDSLSELDFREYESVLLLDSDSVYLRSPVGNQDFPYKKIFPEGINKKSFSTYLDLIKFTNIIFIIMYILLFILFNLIGAFFITTFGNMLLSFKRIPMKFANAFPIACYASTLPILIKTIMHVFSFNIRYFDMIYVLIGILYFWNGALAISKDKSESNDPKISQ